jgi:hypothetical protein
MPRAPVGHAGIYRDLVFDERDMTFRARQASLQDPDEARRLDCVGAWQMKLLGGLRNFFLDLRHAVPCHHQLSGPICHCGCLFRAAARHAKIVNRFPPKQEGPARLRRHASPVITLTVIGFPACTVRDHRPAAERYREPSLFTTLERSR